MNPSEKCNLSIEFLLLDIVYPFNQLWWPIRTLCKKKITRKKTFLKIKNRIPLSMIVIIHFSLKKNSSLSKFKISLT